MNEREQRTLAAMDGALRKLNSAAGPVVNGAREFSFREESELPTGEKLCFQEGSGFVVTGEQLFALQVGMQAANEALQSFEKLAVSIGRGQLLGEPGRTTRSL